MHPRYLIYLNLLILISGLLALYFQWGVQFNLQEMYDSEMIFRLFCISFFAIFGLWVGSRLGSAMPKVKVVRVRLPKISKASTNSLILAVLFVAAVFSFSLFLNSIFLSRTEGGIERVMGGKYLTPLLILLSALTIQCLDNNRRRLLPLYLLTFILILYAYGDGTRAAMVGGGTVFMYSLVVDDRKIKVYSLISSFVVFMALIFGRNFVSGVVLDVGFYDYFDFFIKSIVIFWHYFVTFSGLHAAYATGDGIGYFGFGEFLYSILPIPASIISPPSSTDLWRVDQFRPLGAQAEMWKISPVINFMFAVFMGFLLQRTAKKEKSLMLILVGAILYLAFLMSFQYGLRTIQWFIWLAILILLVNGVFFYRQVANR